MNDQDTSSKRTAFGDTYAPGTVRTFNLSDLPERANLTLWAKLLSVDGLQIRRRRRKRLMPGERQPNGEVIVDRAVVAAAFSPRFIFVDGKGGKPAKKP